MKTDSNGLTGSIIQRISIAVLLSAAFLSAAVAAILPATDYAHSHYGSAATMIPSEDSDRVNLEFAGISPAVLATALQKAYQGSEVQRPAAFEVDGTHLAARSSDNIDIHQWSASAEESTTEKRALTYWYLADVSYPNIKNTGTKQPLRFKPMITYRTLTQADTETLEPIPAVRCMGLSSAAIAKRAQRYEESIQKYSMQYGVSANLVKAVITKESCFDSKARSYVGAIGLMQLMPETAAWLKVSNPDDPQQNLRGGIKYLASLYKRFERIDLTLAAYNAGPGNVERYEGIPPFNETQDYVTSVLSNYRSYTATAKFKYQLASN